MLTLLVKDSLWLYHDDHSSPLFLLYSCYPLICKEHTSSGHRHYSCFIHPCFTGSYKIKHGNLIHQTPHSYLPTPHLPDARSGLVLSLRLYRVRCQWRLLSGWLSYRTRNPIQGPRRASSAGSQEPITD